MTLNPDKELMVEDNFGNEASVKIEVDQPRETF
jgi:hypothetical protein